MFQEAITTNHLTILTTCHLLLAMVDGLLVVLKESKRKAGKFSGKLARQLHPAVGQMLLSVDPSILLTSAGSTHLLLTTYYLPLTTTCYSLLATCYLHKSKSTYQGWWGLGLGSPFTRSLQGGGLGVDAALQRVHVATCTRRCMHVW